MSEYASALEYQVTALQTAADDESSETGQTIVSKFAASAITVHRNHSTTIKELQDERKEQEAQMKRLTALANSIASKSDNPLET